MLPLLMLVVVTTSVVADDSTQESSNILTTTAGAPIEYKYASQSIDASLLSNNFFMESIANLNRERIPERVVHAKGAGALGYFQVTHDITDVCKAKLFNEVGKNTSITVRFSAVAEKSGGIDTSREPRGFAIKFYTEDGNFDFVGLSTEVFLIKDPLFFPGFAHALGRDPKTNLRNATSRWDFLTLRPESLNLFMYAFGDRGIPANYTNMPGFSIHTYQLENENGDVTFVRFHVLPNDGIKTLTSEEAATIAGQNPDYATANLYNQIADGDYPTYTFSIQTATLEEVQNATFDLFDVTMKWPLDDYPLREVGQIVLNENPNNYFAQVEQTAFCPCNLVPGILGGSDKIFESRILAYRDAQYYRLGKNHNNININYPRQCKVRTYLRDGMPYVRNNNDDPAPNYYPNTFDGPQPVEGSNNKLYIARTSANVTNFGQAAELYENEMSEDEKTRLVSNIVGSNLATVSESLQKKAVELYTTIHPDLGKRISNSLWGNSTK